MAQVDDAVVDDEPKKKATAKPSATKAKPAPEKKADTKPETEPKPEPEPIDLSQVNTTDNQFIWIALVGVILTLGGLFWFS